MSNPRRTFEYGALLRGSANGRALHVVTDEASPVATSGSPTSTVAHSWKLAQMSYSLLREEVTAPVLEIIQGTAGEDVSVGAHLSEDEQFIADAYLMAKRAVRIAQGAGGNPADYIGSGDDLKTKAVDFLPMVLANIAELDDTQLA